MNTANPSTPGASGLVLEEATLFDLSRPGRTGASLPKAAPGFSAAAHLPKELLNTAGPNLPELSEPEVNRHFVRLSTWNYNKDAGFFPLGSCTMKYNPRINEWAARLPGFAVSHPYQPTETVQGNLALLYQLEQFLGEIGGMECVTLWPNAGAHGELTGIQIMRAHHLAKGKPRKAVIVPDSAHGTNPASTALCGYDVIEVKSNEKGHLDPAAVARVMTEDVAGIMVTNPSTLGLFEQHLPEVAEIVHAKGGLVYCDGANLNALMGVAKLGHCGADIMHYNLHKTFSTPHGGGGPGAGPVGVKKHLEPYLPVPRITFDGKIYGVSENCPQSIGRVRAFFGNFGVLVRAYTYIREMGPDGLKLATQMAVLNSNYILAKLKNDFQPAQKEQPLHECILTDKKQQAYGVKTLDIAKRLMDYGFHPPTVYFPLIVPGAMMIEPTETESKEACDQFISAMKSIAYECEHTPDIVKSAPHRTFRRRLDEAKAVKEPRLIWKK